MPSRYAVQAPGRQCWARPNLHAADVLRRRQAGGEQGETTTRCSGTARSALAGAAARRAHAQSDRGASEERPFPEAAKLREMAFQYGHRKCAGSLGQCGVWGRAGWQHQDEAGDRGAECPQKPDREREGEQAEPEASEMGTLTKARSEGPWPHKASGPRAPRRTSRQPWLPNPKTGRDPSGNQGRGFQAQTQLFPGPLL